MAFSLNKQKVKYYAFSGLKEKANWGMLVTGGQRPTNSIITYPLVPFKDLTM